MPQWLDQIKARVDNRFAKIIFTTATAAAADPLSTLLGEEIAAALEALDRIITPSIWAAVLMAQHAIDHRRAASIAATRETDFVAIAVIRSHRIAP